MKDVFLLGKWYGIAIGYILGSMIFYTVGYWSGYKHGNNDVYKELITPRLEKQNDFMIDMHRNYIYPQKPKGDTLR